MRPKYLPTWDLQNCCYTFNHFNPGDVDLDRPKTEKVNYKHAMIDLERINHVLRFVGSAVCFGEWFNFFLFQSLSVFFCLVVMQW